ncbi:MAG: sulfatase-like hydrolase/transferase [Bryobacteraceae bacterium]
MRSIPFLLVLASLTSLGARAAPPNIVLIISDDHGWRDYGFMGHPHVRTPHIDRLAKEGLTLTRGYVPTSLCRPSLASIMTGLYPHQHRITSNDPAGEARDPDNRKPMVDIFQQSKPMAGLLAEKGYVSHQSGKWWEGECKCGGFTVCMTHGDVTRGGRHGDEGLKIGRETMQPVFDFIDKSEGKPFFLWYAPFLPHTPHNPPERILAHYRTLGLPIEIAKYYAMVEWLDETVGQLMGHLEEKGLAKNTVVAYLADNGWTQKSDGVPFWESRSKLSPYEDGLRTPILLWGPGIRAERDDRSLASSVDLATTLLPIAGMKPLPEMPGIDLTKRRARSRRHAIYGALFAHTAVDIRSPEANLKYRWMIEDRYKLIVPYAGNAEVEFWPGRPKVSWSLPEAELFDVVADPAETRNLAAEKPDTVRQLRRTLDRWWAVGTSR